jgi:hypothetical protein
MRYVSKDIDPPSSPSPVELRMELLENGLDELASAVEHLEEAPTARSRE